MLNKRLGWNDVSGYPTKHYGLDESQLFAQEEQQLLKVLYEEKQEKERNNNNGRSQSMRALRGTSPPPPSVESPTHAKGRSDHFKTQSNVNDLANVMGGETDKEKESKNDGGWAINSDINVLEFISENIRQSVRDACLQSWLRENESVGQRPTSRQDMLDHYHRRALNHIKQAKQGLNIITVVQMEQIEKNLWYRLSLYSFHSSNIWFSFLHCVMTAHLLLSFWKSYNKNTLRDSHGYSKGVLTTECLCVFVEILDIWMTGLIQFRWQDNDANPLVSPENQRRIFIMRVLVTIAVIVDILVAQVSYVVLSGYLDVRPLILILANDNLLGALYAFVMTMYEAIDGMLLYLIVWGIAAVAGTLTFRFGIFLHYSNLESFYNFIRSMMQSFIFMVSGENYEAVVYASLDESKILMLYFILLTIAGTFIVIPLVVSKFQEAFSSIHSNERERRKFFKRTGFIAAFCLVNLDNDNVVSRTEFEAFISYLKRIPGKEAKELVRGLQGFESFDDDGDDQIEINEFVLHLEKIYNKPTLTDIIEDDSLRTWLRTSIIEKESFNQAVLVIIFTEVMLLMMYGTYPGLLSLKMLDVMLGICVLLNGFDVFIKLIVYGWEYYWNISQCRVIPLIPVVDANQTLRNLQGTSQFTSPVQSTATTPAAPVTPAPIALTTTAAITTTIPMATGNQSPKAPTDPVMIRSFSSFMVSGTDIGSNSPTMMNGPPRKDDPLELLHREFAHRLDLVIVCVSVTLFILTRTIFGSNFFLQNYSWVRIPMIFPLLRMFTLIRTTRAAVYTVFKVIPRFSSLLILMLLVFYVYAVFGTALVGNQIEYLTLTSSSFVYFGFSSVSQAWLSLFQMLVSEGWNNIMNETIIATNNFAWAFYFMSFMFIVTLIFTNLFFGLVLSVVDEIEKERSVSDSDKDLLVPPSFPGDNSTDSVNVSDLSNQSALQLHLNGKSNFKNYNPKNTIYKFNRQYTLSHEKSERGRFPQQPEGADDITLPDTTDVAPFSGTFRQTVGPSLHAVSSSQSFLGENGTNKRATTGGNRKRFVFLNKKNEREGRKALYIVFLLDMQHAM
ncbi:cation transporter [Reticulomyxa filosa]|uniref:Cation transporter n=1 Tax=Reticulomyxa filosa TaxID=46433 RepID=X6NRI5_RETFI|nr:cation transporter [Reticulomyxa filosa]|eukprot:ETO28880.1 cation transporter [Reticulomyxa filosa]